MIPAELARSSVCMSHVTAPGTFTLVLLVLPGLGGPPEESLAGVATDSSWRNNLYFDLERGETPTDHNACEPPPGPRTPCSCQLAGESESFIDIKWKLFFEVSKRLRHY